ncbi:hypothetical protein AJ79_06551 [Helicocarpus griseus UAMH5409]|uniref:Uncharacterized protein n=1 Tax=Helicocarpus griseus UAMH5409 TaxID=1447875 RepID=A0A2B7XCF7_9EURO|nr:hypothetical protein AJ79_06551 [Helicocarpus griseus UAMH5409]
MLANLRNLFEKMLDKSIPEKNNSKITRGRKAVYGVVHEKLMLTINSKLSGYIEKLLHFESAASSRFLQNNMASMRKLLLDSQSNQETSSTSACIPENTNVQTSNKGSGIVQRSNRRLRLGQNARHFSSTFNLSRLGFLWVIQISLNISWEAREYVIAPSLQLQRLVKRTSPAFEVLWKCDIGIMGLSDGLAEFGRIFEDGRASPFDADPEG